MDPIRKQAGVDVEAGHHNNNPPFRSSIGCRFHRKSIIIHSMMKTKTYTAEWHDKTEDFRVVRWDAPVNGVRMGTSIEAFNTEEEAMEVAAILNQGEELDLYHSQACEYDT